jgi:hypothetical protein
MLAKRLEKSGFTTTKKLPPATESLSSPEVSHSPSLLESSAATQSIKSLPSLIGDGNFIDSHTNSGRTKILASLLDNPTDQDLKELTFEEANDRIGELSLLPESIKEVVAHSKGVRVALQE